MTDMGGSVTYDRAHGWSRFTFTLPVTGTHVTGAEATETPNMLRSAQVKTGEEEPALVA